MPNRSDHFLVIAVLSIQCEIEVDDEYESRRYGSGENFTVEFTFIPGYNPNATEFKVFAFVGIDDESHALAQRQQSEAQGVIEEEDDVSADGPAALTDITVANYSTLTSFNTEAFSPGVPGTGGSEEMGNFTARLPTVTVITNFYSLLCIIQDTLNSP
jgi:hypothetical protein